MEQWGITSPPIQPSDWTPLLVEQTTLEKLRSSKLLKEFAWLEGNLCMRNEDRSPSVIEPTEQILLYHNGKHPSFLPTLG